LVGGIGFILAGVAYVISLFFRNNFGWYMMSWSLIIAGPAFLIGVLFFMNWSRKRKEKSKSRHGRTIKLIIGIVLFVSGSLIIAISQSNITGAILGISESSANLFNSLLGMILIVVGIVIFAVTYTGIEKIVLTSAIKKYKPLVRLAEEAARNERVQQDLNHLIKELSRGNLTAGLEIRSLGGGTDIHYMRAAMGARLYYHQVGENHYEIVGKSSKTNQQQVINKLREIYGH
jgi:putative component of toxin-antitoxin plasmid stabilization module